MLKYRLDKASFEKLSEAEQTFYKKDGDNYQLEVDGAVDKTKLDEFRATNVQLMKDKEAYKDIDLEEVKELQEQKRKLLDAEFIDKKDFDGLVDSRTRVIKADYEGKIKNLTTQLNDAKSTYSSTISKYELEGAANKAFTQYKISPDAHEAVMAQVKSKFTVNDGAVVAMVGDKIETGANGNLTVDEFVSSMPEIFKIPSSGGGGQGSNDGRVSTDKTSGEKITSGLTKLLNT